MRTKGIEIIRQGATWWHQDVRFILLYSMMGVTTTIVGEFVEFTIENLVILAVALVVEYGLLAATFLLLVCYVTGRVYDRQTT